MSSDAWKRYSDRGPWYYEVLAAGYKYNMSDMQAALGLSQIDRVDTFRERRREIADAFTEAFTPNPCVTPPAPYADGHHAWHLYPIQIDVDALSLDRDQFIKHLLEEGVGVSVHFIPLHYHPYYRKLLGHGQGSFPVAERYFDRAISLPIYPSMTQSDVSDVIEAVDKLTSYYRR